MKLTAYNQVTVFDDLRSEWNELLHRSIADRVFSTWEWQSQWWAAYHPGELWVITCRDESGRLLGLAPWFIENHPVHGRVVRSIGCVEVTDYLDIIADVDCVETAFDCLAAFLREHRDRFEVVDLCNLPETSPVYHLFPDVLRRYSFGVTVKQQEVCPVIALPSSWEEYLALLDKKQRHELRRKLRRAEGSEGDLSWYIVDASHDLTTELDRFLGLMSASQVEKAQFLTDSQNLAFFCGMVPVAFNNGWLQLNFLTFNARPIAAYLNFTYRDRVLVYNSGILPGEYSHLSPGIVLLALNIQYAIEHGYKVFDFLRGNEIYKYRMGGQDTSVYMLRAQ